MSTAHTSASYDDRVIAAAREVFAENGFTAPMSEVAHRAGVGVASIYRRYPSKQELAEQVRIASIRLIITEAEAAAAEEADPWEAFTRFLRRCLREGTGIGVVLPPLDEGHVTSDEFVRLQLRMTEAVNSLVDAAQRAGELRKDIDGSEVLLLFKHLNPALPLGERRRAELRARYLALVVEGLRVTGPALSGSAPDWAEVRSMCQLPTSDA
jgi:AcrR family transcriptional regulator